MSCLATPEPVQWAVLLRVGADLEASGHFTGAARCYSALCHSGSSRIPCAKASIHLARLLLRHFDNVDEAVSALLPMVGRLGGFASSYKWVCIVVSTYKKTYYKNDVRPLALSDGVAERKPVGRGEPVPVRGVRDAWQVLRGKGRLGKPPSGPQVWAGRCALPGQAWQVREDSSGRACFLRPGAVGKETKVYFWSTLLTYK